LRPPSGQGGRQPASALQVPHGAASAGGTGSFPGQARGLLALAAGLLVLSALWLAVTLGMGHHHHPRLVLTLHGTAAAAEHDAAAMRLQLGFICREVQIVPRGGRIEVRVPRVPAREVAHVSDDLRRLGQRLIRDDRPPDFADSRWDRLQGTWTVGALTLE
jgi:hypothetical protein